MSGIRNIVIAVMFLSSGIVAAQTETGQSPLNFSGQLSSWININNTGSLPLWGGVRYIPQLSLTEELRSGHIVTAEASANIFGSAGLHPFDTLSASGNIKPYRMWARYATNHLEFRLGLQKLNFGSSTLLRPLMWFDQIDPRDPLQLTDGVWGLLGRYYFMNNANIWIWGLYGNSSARGWDIIPTAKGVPEFGGRVQLPMKRGEVAFTYHHRVGDGSSLGAVTPLPSEIPENKFGFDAKWDLVAGLWVEGSYTSRRGNADLLTDQVVITAGADYTFGIGNGIYLALEQLAISFDDTPADFRGNYYFTAMTASYPIGLLDQLGTILYYDWHGGNIYSFLNWKRQYDNIMFYVMAYWNPSAFSLPAQPSANNLFAGRGIQLMFVFNH
ncbi:MAG: hypothetical protein IH591_10220 [Bacteroidales bacterium]|nr:hypothetical protein [Bacteroidales bacterium]